MRHPPAGRPAVLDVSFVITPEVRKTSEIRFHSDAAPGKRFVLVGRTLDPRCRLYIVGRQVDAIPPDQPEWLDDHRHNCPTFYVLIGRNPDLTGLAAEIVIEGHSFVAKSPSAILLPTGFLHHHRLTAGGGWSFHVNVRPDYEESLLDLEPETAPPAREVRVDRLHRRAEVDAPAGRRWEIDDGAISPSGIGDAPMLWTFIDPAQFEDPGIRLHVLRLSARTRGWSEKMHRHDSDEAVVVLTHRATGTAEDSVTAIECATATETMVARAPMSVYTPEGVPHRCRHLDGEGLVLKFLRLA
jgi:hypothetical protein